MYIGIRRAAAAALAVSALALVTACQGGSDDKGAGSDAPAAASPSAASAHTLSTGDAKKILIGQSDLPSGWKLNADYVLDGTGVLKDDELLPKAADATCQPLVNMFDTGRIDVDYKATAQAVFLKGRSQIGQDVTGYSADQAERAMAGLKKAVAGCSAFDSKYGGGKAKVTVKTMDVTAPATADQTIGYSLELTYGDSMVVDVEYGVVREGAVITSVQNNWADDRGIEAFKAGLAKAAAKLDRQTRQAS